MRKDSQNTHSDLVVRRHKGVPVYDSNPSIPQEGGLYSRNRRKQIGNEHKGFVIDGGSGEILGPGMAFAYEWEEVDSERFVKLFLNGLKKASGLSKSGLTIFEIVYNKMRQNPNCDELQISFYTAKKQIKDLAESTYWRGLRELLDKEFLFRSNVSGIFFINIRYMFNGDRLAFVKAYHMKEEKAQKELLLPPD